MTTIIPFLPSNITAPSFIANLDGDDFNIVMTWNVSAQRYYINIYAMDGTWILTVPLIQTPPSRAVESIFYDSLQNAMFITVVDPSLWAVQIAPGPTTKPGTIVDYTLEKFQPDTYNGKFRCLQVDETTFRFPLFQDPGPLASTGYVTRVLNMVAGVFVTSTLVYRNGAFEINP